MAITSFESKLSAGIPVVLLHGLGETSAVWHDPAAHLKSLGVETLCPDLPGAGSARNYDASQLENLDFFAGEIIRSTSGRPAVWVGHSMGGYVALAVARQRPELVKGLLLFQSTPEADSAEKKQKREQSIRIYSQNPSLFLKEFYRNLFAFPERHTDRLEYLLEYGLSLTPEHFIATLRALRDRPDSTQLLAGLKAPKAILAGKHDQVLPYERLRVLGYECGALFYTAENSGHMAMYEEPETALACVLDFIQKCVAS